MADGSRWPGKKVARDSPLSAVYGLFGRAGPVCAVGMAPGDWPSEVTAGTLPHESGCPELTTGTVRAGVTSYPYALRWWLHGGKPVVAEVMPAPHPAVLAPASAAETMARLRDGAPSPRIDLDPVAAALWRAELRGAGLPVAVRCLATWWRLRETVDLRPGPGAMAAAVAIAVARASGLRRGRAETARTYGADVEAVDRVARELGSSLRLDRAHGW